LVADKLLVTGNFARAVAEKAWSTELAELGADSWQAVRDNLPAGVGVAARAAPLLALMTLATWIAWPVGGLAAVAPAFKSLARVFKKFDEKGTQNVRGKNPPEPTQSAARPKRVRRISRPALPRAALEALVLVEATKTPEWADLDKVMIKLGSTPGTWEINGWGQSASKPPRGQFVDIANRPILDGIAKKLNRQFSLKPD
jgi:hypothetical protein